MKETSLRAGELQFAYTKRYFEEFISSRPKFKKKMEDVETPSLLIDLEGIKSRYVQIRYHMPEVNVYYAVKANDHIDVLKALAEVGSGFEIASIQELEKILSLGVPPERVISSNPVKPAEFVRFAYQRGVNRFAVDSYPEVDKIAEVAPRARVYVRLVVPNEGSEWPLSRKFGVDEETALSLLEYAKEKGLVPVGITFHVGSQCNNLRNWFIAIRNASRLWERARSRGLRLQVLNMGGGIPVRYMQESLKVEDIAYYVKGLLRKYFSTPPYELQMEPGRGIVGDQGILVARVIGKAKRGDENWLYVDTGVFNGLAEALGGIRYPIYIERKGDLKEWVVGGVSCDSMDVIAKKVYLPEPDVGDRIFFLSAGAYTTVYASEFNGFPKPKVIAL